MSSTLTAKEARDILWHKGILEWKLDSAQKDLAASSKNFKHKVIVWACSRRLGKSFSLCVLAIEQCLKKDFSVVKYVAPTQKAVKMIITPLMRQILQDCPISIRPEFKTQDNIYRFPNGSVIQMAGVDSGNAEGLRGGESDLCLVDEAGFCDQLSYVVQSILLPTTLTTNGKVILASTPPKNAAHDFNEYVKEAKFKGTFVKKTIYDNPRLTKEQIEAEAEEHGGLQSVDFRREYLVQFITDEESAVIPEFTEELQKEIVKEWKRPVFYDAYTAMDVGLVDLTVVLFAYYDFLEGKLIIEDEFVLNGSKMTAKHLAENVKAKEQSLWVHPLTGEVQDPYLRVSDNNLILINDLQQTYKLNFIPTRKDDADAALNQLRVMLASKKIIINPRCKTLIFHLENATWNKSRTKYERSADFGHADSVDSAKYLVRNVQFNKNPYPPNYNMPQGYNTHSRYEHSAPLTEVQQTIKSLFVNKNQPFGRRRRY